MAVDYFGLSEIDMDQQTQTELEAAAFRSLVKHLDKRKDVQNIDLMILAGFCRNCMSKWLMAAAEDQGLAWIMTKPVSMFIVCPIVNGKPNISCQQLKHK